MALRFVVGVLVAVVGIVGLIYGFSVQLPQLNELKKQEEIAKQEVISGAKETDQASQNLISLMPNHCSGPSPACSKMMEFIKSGCDKTPVKYSEEEQYRTSCKEVERYLNLYK